MIAKDREWIEGHFETLRKEIVKVQIDIAGLKVKSGIWGLIGGAIPVIVMIAVYIFVKK